MVLTLYGNLGATCTKRVRTVLAELALQPFGQVPYLDDAGFTLFESRAIARYLALQYGGVGTLVPDPKDVQKTARFEQAASVEMSNFEPSAVGLAIENLFKPMYGQATDTVKAEQLKTTLEGKMAGYEAILSKTQFLAGDEITLADLFHLPCGALLENQGIDFLVSDRWPNVARWWKAVSSRESWKKVSQA